MIYVMIDEECIEKVFNIGCDLKYMIYFLINDIIR